MKAISFNRFGGPDVLEVVEMPLPRPRPGEALIRVLAAGVGHGDCKLRQGALQAHFKLMLPKTPGRDGIGLLEALANDAHGLVAGDRVAFLTPHDVPGSCAEFVVRPATGLVAVPTALETSTAMAVTQPGCCAWMTLEAAGLRSGERIVVHGAGGAIGSLVVQLAKHIGAQVIATCRSTSRDLVLALGADQVICFDREDPFAQRGDADVVFDPVGGEVHRRSYPLLKPGGRMVYLVAEPIVDLSAQYGVHTIRARIEDRTEVLAAVLQLACEGVLRPQPPRILPLERCAEAHRLLESGRQGPGRIILAVSQ